MTSAGLAGLIDENDAICLSGVSVPTVRCLEHPFHHGGARIRCPAMAVRDRLEERRDSLTPSERRVAEVVLQTPEAVAFGTVAAVAKRARAGGATVVRLAERLGYDGFSGLQDA